MKPARPFRLISLCLGLLALVALAPLSAAPPQTCDPQEEPAVCPVTKYLVSRLLDEDPDDGSDPCSVPECVPVQAALEPTVYCDVSGDEVGCLAGPLTADSQYVVSYRWKRGGSLVGAGGTWSAWSSNPEKTFRCRASSNPVGTVTVAVRSPYNLESSTTVVVACPSVPY